MDPNLENYPRAILGVDMEFEGLGLRALGGPRDCSQQSGVQGSGLRVKTPALACHSIKGFYLPAT